MATFKSYSEKSKARRALVQVYGIAKEETDAYIGFDVDANKYGITLVDGKPVTSAAVQEPVAVDINDPKLAEHPVAQANAASWPTGGKPVEDDEPEAASPSPSAFASFAMAQLTAPSNAAPVEPQRTSTSQRIAGLKIEKDRAQANGVKERSKGGLCRAVWDALDAMMKKDPATGATSVPSVADIKAHAEAQGWNVNNASIEYYQWRKFHGISGRGPKTV
jgi:hypothetical protein